MSAPNKTKKRNKALSYLFRTHLVITISVVVSCDMMLFLNYRHVKNGSFSSPSMNCISMDNIIEVFYHLNKMLIATKHIADNNLVFQ